MSIPSKIQVMCRKSEDFQLFLHCEAASRLLDRLGKEAKDLLGHPGFLRLYLDLFAFEKKPKAKTLLEICSLVYELILVIRTEINNGTVQEKREQNYDDYWD